MIFRYFDDILRNTSEDVEDVIVEANGQWHTADNKYASADWKAAQAPAKALSLSLPPTPIKRRSTTPVRQINNGDGQKRGPDSSEIVILDSDDEDEGQVKRELSPSVPRSYNRSLGSLPARSSTGLSDVIDLTLDSDDEELLARAAVPSKKRKPDDQGIVSPTEQVWKKSRVDGLALPAVSSMNGTALQPAYPSGDHYSPPQPPPPPSGTRDPRFVPFRPAQFNNSYIPPGGAPIPSRNSVPRTDSYGTSSTRVNGSSTSNWRAC